MNIVFLNDCAADGCYKRSVKGKQLCRQHQDMYDRGEPVKAFYGRTLKKNLEESAKSETEKTVREITKRKKA